MSGFQESSAKQAVRQLLFDAATRLQRQDLTYLGMPAESARDILILRPLLTNAICVAERDSTLAATKRSVASLRLRQKRFVAQDMWQYLATGYPSEPLLADVTFLDFYGGGLTKGNPFAHEIAGLRSYFAKHAQTPNRCFVFAWTYMPRDKGQQKYLDTLKVLLPDSGLAVLRRASGVTFRSVAIRMLLRQHLREHGFIVNVFQHAVYKRVMNTLILVFSKDVDPQCNITLGSPDGLLDEPCCVYDADQPVPRLVPLLDV
jgi:hypothetical protein